MYNWQTYSSGIPNKKLTNVEIQEQTASLNKYYKKCNVFFQLNQLALYNPLWLCTYSAPYFMKESDLI